MQVSRELSSKALSRPRPHCFPPLHTYHTLSQRAAYPAAGQIVRPPAARAAKMDTPDKPVEKMTVVELKSALKARGLADKVCSRGHDGGRAGGGPRAVPLQHASRSSQGVKADLVARLQEAQQAAAPADAADTEAAVDQTNGDGDAAAGEQEVEEAAMAEAATEPTEAAEAALAEPVAEPTDTEPAATAADLEVRLAAWARGGQANKYCCSHSRCLLEGMSPQGRPGRTRARCPRGLSGAFAAICVGAARRLTSSRAEKRCKGLFNVAGDRRRGQSWP